MSVTVESQENLVIVQIFFSMNAFVRIKAMQGNFKFDVWSYTHIFMSVLTEEEVVLARNAVVSHNPRMQGTTQS